MAIVLLQKISMKLNLMVIKFLTIDTAHDNNCTINLIAHNIVVGEAVTIFGANTVGPKSYIQMYDNYRDILTGD